MPCNSKLEMAVAALNMLSFKSSWFVLKKTKQIKFVNLSEMLYFVCKFLAANKTLCDRKSIKNVTI